MAMRLSVVIVALGFATTAALAQFQPPKSKQPSPPKPEAPPPAEQCAGYESARNAAFTTIIKQVLSEMPDAASASDREGFRNAVEAAYAANETKARAGDVLAMRKLVSIEVFVAQIQKRAIDPATYRRMCWLADLPDAQRAIPDVLACAVLAADPQRRQDELARLKGRSMLERAGRMIPADATRATHAKVLYEDVKRGLNGCF